MPFQSDMGYMVRICRQPEVRVGEPPPRIVCAIDWWQLDEDQNPVPNTHQRVESVLLNELPPPWDLVRATALASGIEGLPLWAKLDNELRPVEFLITPGDNYETA